MDMGSQLTGLPVYHLKFFFNAKSETLRHSILLSDNLHHPGTQHARREKPTEEIYERTHQYLRGRLIPWPVPCSRLRRFALFPTTFVRRSRTGGICCEVKNARRAFFTSQHIPGERRRREQAAAPESRHPLNVTIQNRAATHRGRCLYRSGIRNCG